MASLTSAVTIRNEQRDIDILVSDLFLAGPQCSALISDFVGEDIRSAVVYRHMDLPIPSVVYHLCDGRIAQKLVKSSGSWYTILIFANKEEFNAHIDQHTCLFDPETGKPRTN